MEVQSKEGDPVRGADLHARKRKRRRCICISTIIILAAVVLLIIILAFTVFKAKRPVTNINSLSLKDFDLNLDVIRLRVSLNVTLDANISVKNPNKVGFKYRNSSAIVRYRGMVVAEAPIPGGKIDADKTTTMKLTITVLADRLLSSPNLYSDIISGTLPLTTSTRIAGKVRIIFFNVGVVSSTTCDLNVDVSSRSIRNQTCHYKTKI